MFLNDTLFYFFNHLTGKAPWFDSLAIFIADYLDIFLIIFVFVLIFVFHDPKPYYQYFTWKEIKHRLKGFLLIMTAGLFAWICAIAVKYMVAAPRPFLILEGVRVLVPFGGFDSFPSGHATLFMGLAVAMYFYHKKLGYFFFFAAILVGLSRIVVGVHFPIDVLVGWIMGAVLSYGIYHLYHYLDDRATIEPWLKSLRS